MDFKEITTAIKGMRGTATDEAALAAVALYPYWKENMQVEEGTRYQYGGKLYRAIQAHTTQADWTPDATPALWAVVSLEEWPEWVQPTGGHDAYATDAKVTHNGIKYISLVDANTWEPGAAGSENLWQAAE